MKRYQKAYKVLTEDNEDSFGDFDFSPWLPGGEHVGEWLPREIGISVINAEHIIECLDAQIWQIEVDQRFDTIRFIKKLDKWNEETASLFAGWCAREALKLFDDLDDPLSVAARNVAERHDATEEEIKNVQDAIRLGMESGARASAWIAALDAVLDAKWNYAWGAAWNSARAAGWNAAHSAVDEEWRAWNAAFKAERAKQTEYLFSLLE
jgi:hypothetical protein